MAKRLASVIRFKKGVTQAQAAKALASIAEVLDFPEKTAKPHYFKKDGQNMVRYEDVPFEPAHAVNEYEEEYGHPVFYVP